LLHRGDQPFDLDQEGQVMALDAKMSFDSNALFRHTEILGCVI
jgi:succinyl-CoA synthetase beta subunit